MENREIGFLLFGVGLVATSVHLWLERRKYLQRSGSVWGKVIGHEEQFSSTSMGSSNSGRSITLHAVIEYRVDNKDYTCVAATGATWIIHPLGSEQEIRYDPRHPGKGQPAEGPVEESLMTLLRWGCPVAGGVLLSLGLTALL